jgi:hypothetical protein
VSASLPLADAPTLKRLALRTRVVRIAVVGAIAAAIAVAFFASRHPTTTSPPYLPARSNGIVVLDLSASISTDTFSQIGDALHALSTSGGRYGLVVFSSTAYEALPPGTPARELGSLVPFFTPEPGHNGFAASFPVNPWTQDFSLGTSISSGLNLARSIVARTGLTHPSLLLISDLNDDPGDLRRLANAALALHRARLPVHVVALSASTEDERLFAKLLGSRGAISEAPAPGTRPSATHAPAPIVLIVIVVVAALLLAAAELLFPPLLFRAGPVT